MDALRKAERARAAREEQAADDAPAHPGRAPEGPSDSGDPTPHPGAAAELSLEPRGDDADGRRERSPETPGAGIERESDDRAWFDAPGAEEDERSGDGFPRSGEQTAATLPSLKAARASVNDYFDGTSSASLSMEQIRSGDEDTTVTGQRAAFRDAPPEPAPEPRKLADPFLQEPAEAARQASARSVLAAGLPPPRSGSGTRWALFLGVPLVLGAGAVGGYLLWFASGQQSYAGWAAGGPPPAARGSIEGAGGQPAPAPDIPIARTTPSPAAPPPAAAAPVNAPIAAAPTGSGGSAGPAGPAGSAAPTPPPAAPAEVPTRGDLSPGREAAMAAGPEPPERSGPVEGGAPAPPPVLSDAQFEAMLAKASPVPAGLGGGSGIQIKRQRRRDPARPLLERGYAAYQRGDLQAAETDYNAVLRMQPANRDAMLGLAALAVRAGEPERAQALYARILTLNPSDRVARAALVQVSPAVDPVAGESQLKLLLREDPGAGYLNFSLGNLYAAQERWAQAQAAYFNAYRADTEDPDYAFNLAVSLDRLDQPAAALQYYRQALELAGSRSAGFRPEAAARRIRAIGSR